MENTLVLEQPRDMTPEVKVSEPIAEEKENVSECISTGSTFGKFKDATSLLAAYENLEKEFTRKSQKLSELIKQQETQEATNNTMLNTKDCENQSYVDSSEIKPLYKQTNWHSNVLSFFNEHPEAKKYASEIAKVIINDKELANNKNCLSYAYASVLKNTNNQTEPASLLNNPQFFDQIVSDEKVKNAIIKNYLIGIQSNQNNLKFISGEPKSISPTQKPDKPKNLKEASRILKRLLEL